MKFKRYLNERKITSIEKNIKYIIELFEKNCKPYFDDFYSIWEGEFFISGRKSNNEAFTKKKVRKNRKPKDTPMEIHDIIDDWFYKKFGIKARSNSIFCSFNENTANEYGNPYYIIPIGKYSTIASPTIKDIYAEIVQDKIDRTKYDDEYDDDRMKKDIISELKHGNYKKNKKVSDSKTHSSTEYMLHCNEYYIINSNEMTDDIEEQILTELGLDPGYET